MKIDKKFVLGELEEAMIKEELAIPLYTSHIEQVLFWSGLTKDKQKKIIDNLQILNLESEGHAKAIEQIMEMYKKL